MLVFDLSEGDQAQLMCDADDLDLDPDVFSALGIKVKHEQDSDGRRLRIKAEADVCLTCDRTLRTFSRKVTGMHEVALLPADEPASDLSDAYHLMLEPWQTKIDLTSVVRDTLLLALPVRKVAPDAEDLVIPTVYGAPEEAEPTYWEALKQL